LCWYDTTGGGLTPEDWSVLDRYVAGEGSEAEREETRLRIQASPTLAAIVEVMRSSRRGSSESGAEPPNTSAAWNALSAKLDRRAPRAPLALISASTRRRTTTSGALGIAAALLILVGGSLVSYHALSNPSRPRADAPTIRAQYQTARGERATIELRDGTRVALAPETKLRIASSDRDVYLSGEAVFTVAHDAARPFRVLAPGGAEVRDIGTRFDVRAYPAERTVRVVVADGAVSLRGALTEPVVLPRGTLGVVDSTAVRVTQGVTVDEYLAWSQGRLTFTNARMVDVVSELSRWYDIDVQLGSAKLRDVRLTLALNEDSPADVTLEVIARAINSRLVRAGQSATLYSKDGEATRE
jgi:ferric-dicitrate binding protein FerR (iron transport regulator)